MFLMCVCRCLCLSAVLLGVTLLNGCASDPTPQDILSRIIFPNKWVGDIDQIGFNEPSGIVWHPLRKTLFVIGDEGDICEIATDGTPVKQGHLRDADLEGITCDPATGLLYVAVEEAETVLEVDPESFAILREFSIPREFDGRTLLAAGGEGIEGITFVPDDTHPQGGIFLVANQAFTLTNEQDISAVFQVELPLRDVASEPRILGWFSPGIIDLSALNYDARTDRLLVVSDSTNTLLVYSRNYELLEVYAFPGDNQEGVTVDPDGYIYIAQDTGGIIKLKWLR